MWSFSTSRLLHLAELWWIPDAPVDDLFAFRPVDPPPKDLCNLFDNQINKQIYDCIFINYLQQFIRSGNSDWFCHIQIDAVQTYVRGRAAWLHWSFNTPEMLTGQPQHCWSVPSNGSLASSEPSWPGSLTHPVWSWSEASTDPGPGGVLDQVLGPGVRVDLWGAPLWRTEVRSQRLLVWEHDVTSYAWILTK